MSATATAALGFTNAASGFAGAKMQANAIKRQAEYQKAMFEVNSKFAELQAQDSVRRGDVAAGNHMSQVRGMIGSQRAAMAAQGIEVDSGSAAEVQADTAAMGAIDAAQIRNNALREAMGYKVEALNASHRGEMAMRAGQAEAKATIATGGLNALSKASSTLQKYKETRSKSSPKTKSEALQVGNPIAVDSSNSTSRGSSYA